MFRKKAKGKDDPPAQPRVSDEYGEKLTRSLSMEIRELRIREKEILVQLKSRGVKADERETRPLETPAELSRLASLADPPAQHNARLQIQKFRATARTERTDSRARALQTRSDSSPRRRPLSL